MKIIAESRPVTAMPFVHLGYMAASYFRPVAGFTLTGTLLAVAGIGLILRLVSEKSKRSKLWTRIRIRCRRSRVGAIGLGLVLVGITCAAYAWVGGERYFPHGESTTFMQMDLALHEIDRRIGCVPDEETVKRWTSIDHLPAEAGTYDLASVFQNQVGKRMAIDGWNNPMKLKVVVAEAQAPDYILWSAGRDRKWGTKDDLTTETRAEYWRKQWKKDAARAEAAQASRNGGQPK